MSDGTTPGRPVRMYVEDGRFADYSTEEVVGQKLNTFQGWKCAAGVSNLCINFDGDILSASCGSIGPEGKSGKYGNIFEDFKLDNQWITCAQKFCSCGADLFIPKIKDENHSHLLAFTNKSKHSLDKKILNITNPVAIERTFDASNKQVFWEIGRRCNYDCSYCHPYVHNNFEAHKTLKQLKFATENLEKSFGKGDKINFAISGGEPTVNPDFLPWVKYLRGKGHRISTHSNGSRPPDYYKELISLSDINISVHFEFYDKQKMLEVLTALALEIYLRKVALAPVKHLEVMLMTLPGRSDESIEFEKEIWEIPHFVKHCTLTVMPIRGHESIEVQTTKSGDELLKEYIPEEFSLFGNRTLEKHLATEVDIDSELKQYDLIDDIKDPEERKSSLAALGLK